MIVTAMTELRMTRRTNKNSARLRQSSRRVGVAAVAATLLCGVVLSGVAAADDTAVAGRNRPDLQAMVQAIAARDYPVVLGATMLYAALVIGANLAADLILPALDPRRR